MDIHYRAFQQVSKLRRDDKVYNLWHQISKIGRFSILNHYFDRAL